MAAKFQAPKGTSDIVPEQARVHERIQRAAIQLFRRAGYGRIETPIFEDSDLFVRTVGESTDIVRKEMFTFEDRGGRSLTLRPEGTAPICRAYIQQGMQKLPQPVQLWYWGPFFRHERPQAGRYREFHQVGAETIGTDSPLADAESIMLLHNLLSKLRVPGVRLRLSSLGSPETRAEYREDLRRYLRAHSRRLSADVRARIETNPMRAFDADDSETRAVMANAPRMLERLDRDDADHFSQVRGLLDTAEVSYQLDGTLVRGLDYYTRTVFEFTCDRLGAQSGIGGGGRYDGLVELLGGPRTAAVGWAAGVERIALALPKRLRRIPLDVFVAVDEDVSGGSGLALSVAANLRGAAIGAQADLAKRRLRNQMSLADRLSAKYALILRRGSVVLRNMKSGEEHAIPSDSIVEETKKIVRGRK